MAEGVKRAREDRKGEGLLFFWEEGGLDGVLFFFSFSLAGEFSYEKEGEMEEGGLE